MKKTRFFNKEKRNWVVVDGKDKILGRLATRIARILQGKNKATYTPNFICGDRVIVINAKDIKLSGNKYNSKVYDKYSGYPGGRKEISLKVLMQKNQTYVLSEAVRRMLPKNRLGREMLRALKIYSGSEHPHKAQMPQQLSV